MFQWRLVSASSSYQNQTIIRSYQKAKTTQKLFDHRKTLKYDYVKNFKSDKFLGGRGHLQISLTGPATNYLSFLVNEAAVSVQLTTKHGSRE